MIKHLKVGSIIKAFNTKEGKRGDKSEQSDGAKEIQLRITNQKLEPRWCGLSSKWVPAEIYTKVRWVPFAPNAINYIRDVNKTVMSGFFSGCIMARYKRSGEKNYRVCHVSTGGGQDCKIQWEDITKEKNIEVVQFKPFGPGKMKGQKVLGLISEKGELYTIWCNSHNTVDLEVVAIDKQLNNYGLKAKVA